MSICFHSFQTFVPWHGWIPFQGRLGGQRAVSLLNTVYIARWHGLNTGGLERERFMNFLYPYGLQTILRCIWHNVISGFAVANGMCIHVLSRSKWNTRVTTVVWPSRHSPFQSFWNLSTVVSPSVQMIKHASPSSQKETGSMILAPYNTLIPICHWLWVVFVRAQS